MAYLKKSRYYIKDTRLQRKKYQGFDYTNEILQRSVSSYLLTNDVVFDTFIPSLNKVLEFNLDAIKDLKKFYAFAIDKHDYEIN